MEEEGKLKRTIAAGRQGLNMANAAGLLSSENSRIGNGLAVILLLTAGVADLFTLIPIAGDFIGPIFWVCVSLYFWSKGFGFMRMGRIVTELVSTILEMIPVAQEFPTIILGMIIVIALMRFEDKTGVSVMKPMSKGKTPLNANGVRQPQNAANDTSDHSRNPNTRPLNIDGVRQPTA